MKIPLLVIAGPTASGKSRAAVELALKLKGEVISADSMQVYKYMDIGTAKVDQATRLRVPHHLLDVVEPNQEFTVVDFKEGATAAAREIWARGKVPILAGGTGLYIKALTDNYPLEHLPRDRACREQLNRLWDKEGRDYMVQWLHKVDPETAAKAADRRRIIRALEIFQLTGKAPTLIHREAKGENPFSPMLFALTLPRPQLYARIEARTDLMVIQGLVGEYTSLLKRGYSPACKAMQGLGYHHCGQYVQGRWTLAEMIMHLKQDTRRYAKRQLSWFRGMEGIIWLDNTEPAAAIQRIYALAAGKFADDGEVNK